MILVVVEHDRGTMSPASWEALAAARGLGETHALTIGEAADGLVEQIGVFGATTVHQVHDDLLADYGPEAWGDVVSQAVTSLSPSMVLATGTDRGNEVMAQAAARLDLPMVANVIEFKDDELVRVRWGGSLLERCTLDAPIKLVTIAHHAFAAAESPATATAAPLAVKLDPVVSRTMVRDRVERAGCHALDRAGGRQWWPRRWLSRRIRSSARAGDSARGRRGLQPSRHQPRMAEPHRPGWSDGHPDRARHLHRVGISGAIQHWVGAMASKKILAINTDPEANMVTKADYAVIGDLHQVVPAITAEIQRRRG